MQKMPKKLKRKKKKQKERRNQKMRKKPNKPLKPEETAVLKKLETGTTFTGPWNYSLIIEKEIKSFY